MKIIVFGAGAWGTALAVSAARHPDGHAVELWARDAAQATAMQGRRENARYLPGIALPQALTVRCAPAVELDASSADLVIVATPMAGLRDTLTALQACTAPVAWLCKGFEAPQTGSDPATVGMLGHEIRASVAPRLKAQPTALVAASEHARVREALVQAFHSATLRVYASDDVPGVEVGGAVKNVLAIATGLCDGLALGLNARAALVTRGLAEIARFGIARGGRAETFMGLSGLGDLVLTATGDLSRNRRVGQLLAQGLSLQQAVDSLGHVAEGVYSARTVVQRAAVAGVDMPISEAVVALLDGRLRPVEAVAALMGREPKLETV